MSRKVAFRFALTLCLAVAGLAAFMGLLVSGREQVYAAPPQAVSGEVSARPAPPDEPNIVRGPSAPAAPQAPSGPAAITAVITRYVAITGADIGTCNTPVSACKTIQFAVDQAGAGDEVRVAAGIYTDTITRTPPSGYPNAPTAITQVVYISKALTIRGGYTTTDNFAVSNPDVYTTTLDAESGKRVIFVGGDNITDTVTLEGLRITGGDAAGLGGGSDAGGGVYVITATITLSDCQITSNTAGDDGGGVYLMSSPTATLSGNNIYSNTAGDDGGGVYLCSSPTATLSGNNIYSNTASDEGGGVRLYESHNATLDNNVIADNQANTTGSGVHVEASTADLRHNTIARNTGGDGSGVHVAGGTVALTNTILVSHNVGISLASGNATLTYTLWGTGTWANVTDTLGNVTTGTASSGNFWGDPVFVDTDYHIGAGSAAIDEGVPTSITVDIDGESRPSSYPDLGADETATFTVTKQGYPDQVQVGGQLTYTIYVTNTGVPLTSTITDTLPTCVTPTGLITWTPTITASGWTTTFVVTVDDPCTSTLTNIVTVTTDQGVTDSATETTGVAGVTVTKQAIPNPIQAGGLLTYTIYVTNTGSVSLTATITDTLTGCACLTHTIVPTPASSFTSTGGITITWSPITIMAPSDVWTATVVVTVPAGCTALTNTVDVATDEGATGVYILPSQAQTTPVLSVTKRAGPDTVLPGGLLTYTLCVTNTGGAANNLLISDTVPTSTTYQPSCSGGNGCGESNGVVTWTVNSLPAGQSKHLTFTVRVTDSAGILGQSIANQTYEVTCTEGVSATGAVVTTSVEATRMVTLTAISPDAQSGNTGTQVTYTLRMTNTGNYTDVFGITGQGVWTPVLSITDTGSIGSGDSRDVIVTVTIPAGATGGVMDTAVITAASQGGTNKSASVVLTTTANTVYSVALTATLTDTQSGDPGTQVTYTLRVSNTGNDSDAFTITKSSGTWPTHTLSITDTDVLASGAFTDTIVTVTIPAGARPGDSDTLIVTATSQTSPTTVSDISVLTTTVARPHPAWEKLVYVNSTTPITDITSPITVTTGDVITIVDQVWITYTAPVTFTLVESWTNSLELTLPVTFTAGNVPSGTGWLKWEVTNTVPYTWHVITKTFIVTNTTSFDYVTETLWVEGADPQLTPITLTFRNVSVCLPVSIDGLTSDSLAEIHEAMHFTATVSGDPPITYTWDFGGPGSDSGTDGATPAYTYTTADTYTVTLDVENSCPSTDTDFITVTVNLPTYTLTIATDGTGSGTVGPSEGPHSYFSGTQVPLTATAFLTSTFVRWHGDLVTTTSSVTITMDGDKVVTATFDVVTHTLAVTTIGSGTVAITPTASSYITGTQVKLTATPSATWMFADWSGDLITTTNPVTITMDSDKAVTATFHFYSVTVAPPADGKMGEPNESVTYTLRVTNTGGITDTFTVMAISSNTWTVTIVPTPTVGPLAANGVAVMHVGVQIPTGTVSGTVDVVTFTVTSQGDPRQSATSLLTTTVTTGCIPVSGFDFGFTPANPEVNQVVTFTSEFGQGSQPITYTWDFLGDGTITDTGAIVTHTYATSQTYTVFMTVTNDCSTTAQVVSKTVTVVTPTYTLLVATDGTGSGTVILTPAGGSYLGGTQVTLTANAASTSTFVAWSGAVAGITNTVTITMNSDEVVTATFDAVHYTLTVAITGTGSGTVEPFVWPHQYLSGTMAIVTATAHPTSTFMGWSGDLGGVTTTQSLLMDGDKFITATFDAVYYTLTVATDGTGSGTVEPFVWPHQYLSGTMATVTATASSTSTFAGWSGDLGGTTRTQSLLMDGNKFVTATFDAVYYTLTVATDGTGSGTVEPFVWPHQYLSGTMATVTATASSTSTFAGWSGDLGGVTTTQSLLMDGDKFITATFDAVYYTLTVATDGTGSGTVEPFVWPHQYLSGTMATVTATASSTSTFAGWSGDLGGTTRTQSLLMDGDKFITATFDAVYYTLTVATDGTGSGTVEPFVWPHQYLSGTMATVTATASSTSTFAGWSGDLGGVTTTQSLLMDANKFVTATFDAVYYTLTVATDGTGSGTVEPFVWPHQYLSGTMATVTATASSTSTFAGWSGDLGGVTTTQSLLMDANKFVTATFDAVYYTLTVATDGTGSGTVEPFVWPHQYLSGTMATVTATASSTSTFAGWSGDLGGTTRTQSLLMDGDKFITATFTAGGVELYQPTRWLTSHHAIAVHTVTITNTSSVTKTFDITYGVNIWPYVDLSQTSIKLGGNVTATLVITVHIPLTATNKVTDTVTITATEQGGGPLQATSVLTTFTGCRYNFNYPLNNYVDSSDVFQVVGRFNDLNPLFNFNYPLNNYVDSSDVFQVVGRFNDICTP